MLKFFPERKEQLIQFLILNYNNSRSNIRRNNFDNIITLGLNAIKFLITAGDLDKAEDHCKDFLYFYLFTNRNTSTIDASLFYFFNDLQIIYYKQKRYLSWLNCHLLLLFYKYYYSKESKGEWSKLLYLKEDFFKSNKFTEEDFFTVLKNAEFRQIFNKKIQKLKNQGFTKNGFLKKMDSIALKIFKDTRNTFVINKFLSVKLIGFKTFVLLGNQIFRQCKFLLLRFPVNDLGVLNATHSIDEASELLDHSAETTPDLVEPTEEFWGHCSNLQAWVENGYDTRILYRNLAFPLLKKLTKIGDVQAKKVFKEEIAERYENGTENVKKFLKNEGYLDHLSKEELASISNTSF